MASRAIPRIVISPYKNLTGCGKAPDVAFPCIGPINLINPPVVSGLKVKPTGIEATIVLVAFVDAGTNWPRVVGIIHIVKIITKVHIV
jgi:hypothetical protein